MRFAVTSFTATALLAVGLLVTVDWGDNLVAAASLAVYSWAAGWWACDFDYLRRYRRRKNQ